VFSGPSGAAGRRTIPVVADLLEGAWFAVHDALPAGWRVGLPAYDPGRTVWSVTARSPHPGRGKAPVTVSGTGDG
jgi:hypothetical protein